MSEERCETCWFWRQGLGRADLLAVRKTVAEEKDHEPSDYGQCHRMPPTVNEHHIETVKPKRQYTMILTEFPDTVREDWCGEYRKRPA